MHLTLLFQHSNTLLCIDCCLGNPHLEVQLQPKIEGDPRNIKSCRQRTLNRPIHSRINVASRSELCERLLWTGTCLDQLAQAATQVLTSLVSFREGRTHYSEISKSTWASACRVAFSEGSRSPFRCWVYTLVLVSGRPDISLVNAAMKCEIHVKTSWEQ
jgi:hypothetical protein